MKNSLLDQFKTSEKEMLNSKDLHNVVGGASGRECTMMERETCDGVTHVRYCDDDGQNCTAFIAETSAPGE